MTANPNGRAISNTRELGTSTANPNSSAIFNARELHAMITNPAILNVRGPRALIAHHNSSATSMRTTPANPRRSARAPFAQLLQVLAEHEPECKSQ